MQSTHTPVCLHLGCMTSLLALYITERSNACNLQDQLFSEVACDLYAQGTKTSCCSTTKGLSQNGIDREIKVKGLLSLFLYPYATSLFY